MKPVSAFLLGLRQSPWLRRLLPTLLVLGALGVALAVYSNGRSKNKRAANSNPVLAAAAQPDAAPQLGVQPEASPLAAGGAVPLAQQTQQAERAPVAAPALAAQGLATSASPSLAAAMQAAAPTSLSEAMRSPSGAMGCLIEASATAEVGTPVIGIVERVLVERGDRIKRGQILAHHDNRLERAALVVAEQKVANNAELRAAKSQLTFATRKAERTAELTTQNYVSGQAREQADTEAQLARMRLAQAIEQRQLALKELDLAQAQLQQRTIVSPIGGVVVDRLVSVGERVENRPIFRIAQIDPLRVEVVLPSSQFGRIAVGATARVTPEMPGSTVHEARVSIVDPVVDAASNTFRARLSLPNPTFELPAGVRCRVEFTP
jgi:membrane fusion protein, heavy metal efflux system